MNSRQRNVLLGGALFAGTAAVAGAIYFLNKEKNAKANAQPAKSIPKEKVIVILKEIQREMFAVLTNISMIANQLKEQSRGRIQNQEIRDYLLHMNPQAKSQIQQISDTVCKKHGVEEKDLKYACEHTYTEDKEIRVLLNEAKTSFDKAFMGKGPDLRTEIPAFLTPELTLQIMMKIMKETIYKIHGFLQELKSKGIAISYTDPQVMMGLQDLKLEDIKLKVVVEEGLDKFEDSPLKIFQFATQKYSAEDPNQFTKKIMKLEMQNTKAMEAVMKDAENVELLIEAIGSHLVQDEEDLTVSSHFKKSLVNEKKETDQEETSEDEEIKALGQIKELRHQVSLKLKSTLEDSAFPQELVDSAINTLFNVFDKIEKTPTLRKSGKTTPKNDSRVFETEEVKESSAINGESTEVILNAVENQEGESQVVTENVQTEEKAPVTEATEATEEIKVSTQVEERQEGEPVNEEVAQNNEEVAQNNEEVAQNNEEAVQNE